MKNPFNGLKNAAVGIKKMSMPQVRLKFTSCGEVLIDGLPFSFSVESDGISSDKGLIAAVSGEAVDNGSLVFDKIEMKIMNGSDVKSSKKKFEKVTKKDGKKIYRAKFSEAFIPEASKSDRLGFHRRLSEKEFLSGMSSEIIFKITPSYKCQDESEVMITVYPIENPLNGLAVQWKSCTADKEWFEHRSVK